MGIWESASETQEWTRERFEQLCVGRKWIHLAAMVDENLLTLKFQHEASCIFTQN